jgi:hypothetical protein
VSPERLNELTEDDVTPEIQSIVRKDTDTGVVEDGPTGSIESNWGSGQHGRRWTNDGT